MSNQGVSMFKIAFVEIPFIIAQLGLGKHSTQAILYSRHTCNIGNNMNMLELPDNKK